MAGKVLLILLLAIIPYDCFALRPKWVENTPNSLNDTYMFIQVVSYGNSVGTARMNAIHELALNKQLADAAIVNVESGLLSHSETDVDSKGNEKEKINESYDLKIDIKNQKYEVQAKKIDEYSERQADGEIKLYTLYMVALSDNPDYDKVYLTESYGATPALMSIIPGVGQWYKGSKAKGSIMFAAEAASLASVIICENQRSSHLKKANEQPKFAKEYSSKADNWENCRNVSIGVAAGVWVWSIVDAAVAKGARRVIVKQSNGQGLSIHPHFTLESAGVSLAYNF